MNFFDEINYMKGETQNPKFWKISYKLNLLTNSWDIFSLLKSENTAFKNLLLLVKLALALVGINAYVEEVFPFVNALKTIKKNQFIIETVKESLLIKTYFPGFFYIDLYSFFCQHNTKFLLDIHQTDKIL
jgi:hypothetical protein